MAIRLQKTLKTIGFSIASLLALASLGLFLLFYAPDQSPKPGTIRVACVGDSITFGLLAVPRAFNSYPVQLQKMLGENYSVRNFGVNAHTAQKGADHPYWNNSDFQKSTDYAPNVVILMLGTNDAKTFNWKGINIFMQDYGDLVTHYQSLPSKPEIYVMSPPTAFIVQGKAAPSFDITIEAVDAITAGVKRFASERNLKFIDINTVTATHPEHFTFDGIHPNIEGTKLIAANVFAALESKP